MNLKRRIERIESKIKPAALKAVIQGLLAEETLPGRPFIPSALDPDDPTLNQAVDGNGEALISRWWLVTFLEGTTEQQNERLQQLRRDGKFQKPFNEHEVPVLFEGGARCDDMLLRLHKQRDERRLPARTSFAAFPRPTCSTREQSKVAHSMDWHDSNRPRSSSAPVPSLL